MQNIEGYPTDLTVAEPEAFVTVNGTPLDVASVSVTRELSSSLPAQVSSASGITAATGSVEWAAGKDVAAHSSHPWDGEAFPPKPSDDVVVYMGYGDVLARQLTGVVDSSSGSASDGEVSSSVVDPIDKLNRQVSFPPHMIVMPPWDEGGPFLAVNNTPTFTTDRVLRACGFYATPKAEPGAVFSAPLMGSAWPEIGKIISASQNGFPSFPPSFINTHWGVGPNSILANWTPVMSGKGTNKIDATFWMSFKVRNAAPVAGSTEVAAWWGAARIILRVTQAREIEALLHDGTTLTSVCKLSAAATADTFLLRVTPAGVFTILGNNGASTTGTLPLPAVFATTNMTSVSMTSPHQTGAIVGGVQAGFFTYDTHMQPCTAVLTAPAETSGLDAVPAINDRVALEVLKEQAQAECAAMWIDEFGVFRWVNRDTLTSSAPVATLTALDDVLDIGWESDASGVRAGVQVKSRHAHITRMPVSSVTLHRGQGESLQSGETTRDVVEPGADESWFNVYFGPATSAELNRGEKSIFGGIVSKDGAPDVWAETVGKLTYTVAAFSSEKFAITHTAGTLGAGETVILKTSETDTTLKPFRRDKALPIWRGKGRVRWNDITTKSTVPGPVNASWLEHDAGFWVQDPAALQELADWIGAQVSAPRPVLRDLSVIPDFRRQLGDVVWIDDPENMRIRLKLLVTKISNSVTAGGAEQTIAGRILEVQTYGATNAQLDKHAADFTNGGFDVLWGTATNAQLDSNPLGRG